MTATAVPVSFMLAATEFGPLIINRNDARDLPDGRSYGVGHDLLTTGSHDRDLMRFECDLLDERLDSRGPGLIALDCGAHVGARSVMWARHMRGWGEVLAFEPQERLFYALAGNLAINNCANASATHAALGEYCGQIGVPQPDYDRRGSFGNLELRKTRGTEFIGQEIDYGHTRPVRMLSVDSLSLGRVDLLRVDSEGMEFQVLEGARKTLGTHKPLVMANCAKTPERDLRDLLEHHGYSVARFERFIVAAHASQSALLRFCELQW